MPDYKLTITGLRIISANYHLKPWEPKTDQEIDETLEKLTIGLQKLAQHLNLDLIDEEGYIIH